MRRPMRAPASVSIPAVIRSPRRMPDFSPREATAAERAAWFCRRQRHSARRRRGHHRHATRRRRISPCRDCNACAGCWMAGDSSAFGKGLAETTAALPRANLPVVVIHGLDDGLVPPAFSSAPYVAAAKAAGREVSYWQVKHAQHFDGFLALPAYGARYVPLLPYVYAALDQVSAQSGWQGQAAGRRGDRIHAARRRQRSKRGNSRFPRSPDRRGPDSVGAPWARALPGFTSR